MDAGKPPNQSGEKALNPKKISRKFDLLKILWGILIPLSAIAIAISRFKFSETTTKILTTIIPFLGLPGAIAALALLLIGIGAYIILGDISP